jgi:hypothetical protein
MCDSTFPKVRRATAILMASDAAAQDHESGLRGPATAALLPGSPASADAVSTLWDSFREPASSARGARNGDSSCSALSSINHHNEN